jgi:CrcB protein
MTQTLAIAVGGALGALGRHWVANGVYALLGRGFPYGTLVVNLLGSLAMGWLYVLFVERLNVAPEWRGAIMVGFLGAFTTFSTFSLETLALFEQGDHWKAGLNIVLSVVACIAAAWVGIVLGRTL